MTGYLDPIMFAALMAAILPGFPVAFSIAGVAIGFACLGWALGAMDISLLGALVPGLVLIAINLQTSFLMPPFGFSLFYRRGAVPPEVSTARICRGVAPFILLQAVGVVIVWLVPGLATWLATWLATSLPAAVF